MVSTPLRTSLGRARPASFSIIAAVAVVGIGLHLTLRMRAGVTLFAPEVPLYVVLFAGGIPLVFSLAVKLVRGQFGSDRLLAGISIVAATLFCQHLAGALVVLMLSGGEALEAFALGRGVVGPSGARASDASGRPPSRRSPGR